MTTQLVRIGNKGHGTHKPSEWINRGDSFVENAKILRRSFKRRRKSFSANIKSYPGSRKPERLKLWATLDGLPVSSHLLLGYGCEMYLKAALAKAFRGCEATFFDAQCRQFSHCLIELAQEVDIGLEAYEAEWLSKLSDAMANGRYPLPGTLDKAEYVENANLQTSFQWDDDVFSQILNLAVWLRNHASMIDNDSEHTALFDAAYLGSDGYVAMRIGGRLRPRVTFKPSSEMISAGKEDAKHLHDLIKDHGMFGFIAMSWDSARIIRHRGVKRQDLQK